MPSSARALTTRLRSLAVVIAVAVTALAGAAASAAADVGQATIGGPQLAARGVAVARGVGTPALPKGISASGWLVADLDTNQVLAARDAHGGFMPASTLKTLTAITLLPKLDPTQMVTATNADLVDGTKVGLVPGMRYSVRDLFTAMLVMSANDAAMALSDADGGMQPTLAAMTETAQHLQADDTVARTPHGLDAPGQVSSAYDLALIAKAGLAMPSFRHYISIRTAEFPAPKHEHYQIGTHDRLLVNYRGAIGIKDGYTVHARCSYVGAASRGGHTLVATLLHANPGCWHEAAKLLDWGFAALPTTRPVGSLVGPVSAATASPTPATPVTVSGHSDAVALASTGSDHSGGVALPVGAAAGGAAAILLVGQRLSRRRARRYRPALPRR